MSRVVICSRPECQTTAGCKCGAIVRNPPWPGPRIERPEDKMRAGIEQAREVLRDSSYSPIDAILVADRLLLTALGR